MKKLLTIIAAVGLTSTSSTAFIKESNIQNFSKIYLQEQNDAIEYGTNSLTSYLNTNELKRVFYSNTFKGEGLETHKSKANIQTSTNVKTLINNPKINLINLDAEILIDGPSISEPHKSVLLKRTETQSDKVIFQGGIIEKDLKGNLINGIELELTYYIKDNKGFVSLETKTSAVDAGKYINPQTQEVGIAYLMKVNQTTWYQNNTIDESQNLGNELLTTFTDISSSNSAVVVSKEKVVKESVSGLTGKIANNSIYHFENAKRVSFYGKMRFAIHQGSVDYDIMVGSIDFIKNEKKSTDTNIVFETNYEALRVAPEGSNKDSFYSGLNLTMSIKIDPVTNRARFENNGAIILDNSKSVSQYSWMETTWTFDTAAIWK